MNKIYLMFCLMFWGAIIFFGQSPLFAESYSTLRTRNFSQTIARMCRIQVRRSGSGNSTNTDWGVGARKVGRNVRVGGHAVEQSSYSKGQTVSTLVVSDGLRGSIEVDGEAVVVRCSIRPRVYELEISVYNDTKTQTKALTTTISLISGQEMEIGSIVRDLRAKGRTLSTNSPSGETRAVEQNKEQVYVRVEAD